MELSLVLVNPTFPVVESCKELFKNKRKEPIVIVETIDEVIEIVSNGLPCVVVICVEDDSAIAKCQQMAKAIMLERKDRPRRVIVVSRVQNDKLHNALLTRGVSEVLQDRITPTALVFKMSLHLTQVQRLTGQVDDEITRVKGSKQAVESNTMISGSDLGVHTSDQMIQKDLWIIKGTAPKKIGVQWVVELAGPDPDSGSWEPVEDSDSRMEKWLWIPQDKKGTTSTMAPVRGWEFAGNKPIFDATTEKWKFVAAKPSLILQEGPKSAGAKIAFDPEKGLVVAKDNPEAEKRIAESKKLGTAVRHARQREAIETQTTGRAVTPGVGAGAVSDSKASAKDAQVTQHAEQEKALNSKAQGQAKSPADPKVQQEAKDQLEAFKKQSEPKAAVASSVKSNGATVPTAASATAKNASITQPGAGNKVDPKIHAPAAKIEPAKPGQSLTAKAEVKAPILNQPGVPQSSAPVKVAPAATAQPAASPTANIHKAAKKKSPSSHVGFFFQLSQMVNKGASEVEIVHKAMLGTQELLYVDKVVILRQPPEGGRRHAYIIDSTDEALPAGKTVDLETTLFKDALTLLQPHTHETRAFLNVSIFPLLPFAQAKASLGAIVLLSTAKFQMDNEKNLKFMSQVTKQLARILHAKTAA